MFGTIKPCKKCMAPQQRAAYQQHYCGLCFALQRNFGKAAQLLVNYDLANNYLLSGSSRNDGIVETGRCPWNLFGKKMEYITYPELSDYYAQLNFLLVYFNLQDDIQDDGSLVAKWICSRMEKHCSQLEQPLGREANLLRDYLTQLHQIEQENQSLPVMHVAHLFGKLLQNMVKPPFVLDSDESTFSLINYWVGVWIYTVDAIVDVLSDGIKKHYNPILAGLKGSALQILRSRKEELLEILRNCVENITLLLEIYPTYENAQLLHQVFRGELPKIICLYLEVEKDELIPQSKTAAG